MADAISTSNMWPNYSTGNVQKAASTSKSELGKDQFLTILVAQLKNQDPMSPMENTEFIGQMAQFSSLEQLINIGKKIDSVGSSVDNSLGASSQLIGKKITWPEEKTDSATGEKTTTYQSGVVGSIVLKAGVQYAQVGENAVPLSIIAMVEAANATTTPTKTDTTTPTPATTPATTPPSGVTETPTAPVETTTPATTTEPAATTPTTTTEETATPSSGEQASTSTEATPTTSEPVTDTTTPASEEGSS
ncbi:flagellar basal-body rod modification protein FlgD [Paenibacillus sp. SORGH_AS306]|uniref:flagellar hook capping FlgD N-terminal domain-containing protein n=1 Tax=unclassified Paenibacillus TaxID=185978 RepID=UPI0027811597|nr:MULTISPECIES: flagellar hook capping FlgD N-terminal domain-containing protein [unclassified Paenibacillus]MDQ1233663.1 flagellar basal-body rod modification protein FlgD [Paenibacillus sp. SORGH_AS_0306]MDR6110704.1 flagellar basal-body rod modification protein FlgD [Paenibacillus sp. SORGH_AS_0338]